MALIFTPTQANINLSFVGDEATTQVSVNIVGHSCEFNTADAAFKGFNEPLTAA